MDPLSAAGFASSLITFIDFSYKLIHGSVDLYKSAAGATDDNVRISSIVEDLKKITETISTPAPLGDKGPHTRELSRLALECHGVSKELTDILDKLKRREGNKAWRSLEAAWKSMRKSDKVAALENQLATYRMQLLLRLGIILAENQTSVEKQLSELQRGNTDHFAQTITQLGNVRQAIETLDKRVMDEAGHALHTLPDMNPSHGALDEIRAELSSIVQTLQAVAASTPADLHVLNRLYFESLHAREDDVRDAEFNTFAWLLHEEGGDEESSEESDEESGEDSDEESIDSYYSSKTVASTGGSNHDTGDDTDSPTHTAVANDEAGIDDDDIEDPDHGEDTVGSEDNEDADDFASVHSSMSDTHVSCLKARRRLRKTFKKWLRLENGLFHIFGKAGSGKSTLMKRTCQDQVLWNELSVWAADRKLVLGSFFFWLSDNESQCSLEGLYRSLLFEALPQCPELTRTAFPQFWTVANEANFETTAWTQSPFRLSELCQALQNLIEQQSGARTHRFCFFIDGLDEFKGDISDHRKLARQLRAWGSSPDVKICVSSRPDQAFLDVFDSKMRINIVDATKLDIYRFVKGTLAEQPATYLSPHILHEIAMQIWDRADGVFLWARLVVRSVTEGILYRSSHRALMDKVEQTPKGLGALFGQMFDSIGSSDRERSDRMLLFASRQGRGHFLLYSWLDDLADPGFPFEGPIRGLPMEEYLERKSTLAAQLKLLSKGLLEISEGSGIVDFFHRSVLDFLRQPDIESEMKDRLQDPLDIAADWQRLQLALAKFHLRASDPTRNDCLVQHLYMLFQSEKKWGAPSTKVLREYHAFVDNFQEKVYISVWHVSPTYSGCLLVPGRNFSFLHFLAYYSQSQYVIDWVEKSPSGQLDREDLCLLFSACIGGRSQAFFVERLSFIERLLGAGASFADGVRLMSETRQDTNIPGWAAFLSILFMDSMRTLLRGEKTNPPGFLFLVLEKVLFLQPELNVQFEYELQAGIDPVTRPVCRSQATMSLEELVVIFKPPNMDVLLREILRRKGWNVWGMVKKLGSRVAPSTDFKTEYAGRIEGMTQSELEDCGFGLTKISVGAGSSWEFDTHRRLGFRVY